MLDHYHDGSGTGSSRQQAERSAIVSWSEFTAWEYGTPVGALFQCGKQDDGLLARLGRLELRGSGASLPTVLSRAV